MWQNALTGNWRTTLVGWGLGALTYLTNNGTSFPANRREWGAAGVSFLMGILGTLAKDSAVGSQAK